MKSIYRHVIGGKHKLANLILHKDKEKTWEKNMFENVQRHYSSLFSSIVEEDFGLRGHNEFQSLECYQFVAGEDSSGKYIEFTGRSTKNFKEGLAHWKLYNKQIRHYGQPGKSYSVYKTVSFITLSVENIGFAPFISLLT